MEIGTNIMELSAIVVETTIITYFFSSFFELKNSKLKYIKYLLLFVLVISIEISNYFINYSEAIMQTLFVLTTYIYSVIFLKGSNLEKITATLINAIIIPFINLPVLTAMKYILGMDFIDLISNRGIIRVETLIITKLLYFIVVQIFLKLKKRNAFNFKSTELVFISISTLIILAIDIVLNDIMLINIRMVSIAILLLFILEVFIAVMVMHLGKANRKLKELEIQNLESKLKNLEVSNLTKRYNELNEIKHDLNNYLSIAINLIQNKNYEGSLNYLKELQTEKISNVNVYVATSNEILNAIINTKLTKAVEKGIKTQAWIANDIDLNDNIIEISSILSNLLDNAIENCSENNPEIILNILKDEDMNVITVKNTVDKLILEENPNLKTKKENKDGHGIGLKSVNNSVKQINGSMNIYQRRNIFVAEIVY